MASPLGFAESTRAFLAEILRLLEERGHQPFDPWAQPENALFDEAASLEPGYERIRRFKAANREAARANERGLRQCDFVLAILDGADVDSGTASEIGFAFALGKPVLGLRTDKRRTGENDAAIVNLQVQYWIEESGGQIYSSLEELGGALASAASPIATR